MKELYNLITTLSNEGVIFKGVAEAGKTGKGPFTNYVYKWKGVGGQKNRLFVNFYTIENVNEGG